MSSPDVFASSPPRRTNHDSYDVMSSSPSFPSIDEIFAKKAPKKQELRSGSHAVPLPDTARTTFISAAHVLREAPEIDIDTEKITRSPPRRTKATKKSTQKKQDAPEAFALESPPFKDKPWQKYKTRQDDELMLPKDHNKPVSKKLQTKKSEIVSKHFPGKENGVVCDERKQSGAPEADEPCSQQPTTQQASLESAIARRHDWTPPRLNSMVVLDSDSDARELWSSADKTNSFKDVFQTLHEQYGMPGADPSAEPSRQSPTDVLGKRKQIQMVSIGREDESQASRSVSPVKEPAQKKRGKKTQAAARDPSPKKKTRTITELAVAPYAPADDAEMNVVGPADKDSLLNYFDIDGSVTALVEHQSAVMSQKIGKGKAPKPPPKTKRKKRAGTETNPILLSPNSALKQCSNQDFLFGTSSQLMREASPTMLRDLQTAIQASNHPESDPFKEDESQRLWQAGARNEDGGLLEMDLLDLQHGSGPIISDGPSFVDINDLLDTPMPKPAVQSAPNTAGASSFVDIDDLLDSPMPRLTSHSTSNMVESSAHFPTQKGNGPYCKPQSTNDRPTTNTAATEISRPDYNLFTDAQLTRQISSYGFKPVRKRVAMIALLDECWLSKQEAARGAQTRSFSTSIRSPSPARKKVSNEATSHPTTKPRARSRSKAANKALGTTTTSTALSTATAPLDETTTLKKTRGRPKKDKTAVATVANPSAPALSPKRPRGRPRKTSSTSLEVADSEAGTPSPVSSPERVLSSPPAMDLTNPDEANMSLTLSPTDQQAELFRYITRAVTSAPRAKDPTKPSWHEKMLLFDPIVLEELAMWLNSGALSRVGHDGEVSPHDVKKWCESKSVMCLWKQNLNGKERKRY